MARVVTRYEVEVEVLTPLHIGSGRGRLLRDYDFLPYQGKAWVIDLHRALMRLPEEELLRSPDITLSRALKPEETPAYARYSLPLDSPDLREDEVTGVMEAVKTADDRPYIPGSSLKGALRTALGWYLLPRYAPLDRPYETLFERHPFRADDRLERRIFGTDPNRDLLRALRPSDLMTDQEEALALYRVTLLSLRRGVLEPRGPGAGILVEAIRPGTRFRGTITLDDYIFSSKDRPLGLEGRRGELEGMARAAQEWVRELIREEQTFYRGRDESLARWYEALERRASALDASRVLLWFAWGAGWGAKTFGSRLKESPHWAQLRREFRLGRAGEPQFPKSRRVASTRDGRRPLGWVLLTLTGS